MQGIRSGSKRPRTERAIPTPAFLVPRLYQSVPNETKAELLQAFDLIPMHESALDGMRFC